MPALPNINRASLTTPLLDRYNSMPNLANVGGGSARDVGTSRAATDMINGTAVGIAGRDVHSAEFGRGGFTAAATRYSSDVLKVDTTPYKS